MCSKSHDAVRRSPPERESSDMCLWPRFLPPSGSSPFGTPFASSESAPQSSPWEVAGMVPTRTNHAPTGTCSTADQRILSCASLVWVILRRRSLAENGQHVADTPFSKTTCAGCCTNRCPWSVWATCSTVAGLQPCRSTVAWILTANMPGQLSRHPPCTRSGYVDQRTRRARGIG